MKRMFGLVMMVGLVASVVGCGDDDNPVKSNQDLLVGTWLAGDGVSITFRSDGTFVDSEGVDLNATGPRVVDAEKAIELAAQDGVFLGE